MDMGWEGMVLICLIVEFELGLGIYELFGR